MKPYIDLDNTSEHLVLFTWGRGTECTIQHIYGKTTWKIFTRLISNAFEICIILQIIRKPNPINALLCRVNSTTPALLGKPPDIWLFLKNFGQIRWYVGQFRWSNAPPTSASKSIKSLTHQPLFKNVPILQTVYSNSMVNFLLNTSKIS